MRSLTKLAAATALLLAWGNSAATTCSCASVPLLGTMELGTPGADKWFLATTYEYHDASELVSGSSTVPDSTGRVRTSEALVLEAAARAGVSVRIGRLLVENAWPLFVRGDFNAYLERIADALMSVDECDVVVLAQASMAGAAELCKQLTMPVLSVQRTMSLF